MIAALASAVLTVVLTVVLLVGARVYARRRVQRERLRFAAADRKTWRGVVPFATETNRGTASHIAAVIDGHAPLGITYTYRIRDTRELELGTVRISIESGTATPLWMRKELKP